MDPQLKQLLDSTLPQIAREITALVRGKHSDAIGSTQTTNATGDTQVPLDVASNEVMKRILAESKLVRFAASEEEESIVEIGPAEAPFSVCFDPLDGSSLVGVNLAVGTIFGVHKTHELMGKTGRGQVAAGIIVYGPRTTMLLTTGNGVAEFILNEESGALSPVAGREKLTLAEESKYFAPGNLRAGAEREEYRAIIDSLIQRKLTLRYSGGLVPDINLMILKGSGVFTYPGYSEMPMGKLRLLFECAPIAMLIEQAGGSAMNDTKPILDLVFTEVHQKTPLYCGSKQTVEEIVGALNV